MTTRMSDLCLWDTYSILILKSYIFLSPPNVSVTESVCCIQDDNVVTIPVVLALVPMMEFCHCTRISGTKFPSEYNVFCCLCLKQVNISFESSSSFSGGFCA